MTTHHAEISGSYTPTVSRAPTSAADPQFVGSAPAHREALRRIEQFAAFEHVTVLIEGESGTGKSFAARYLHQRSPRARGPFQQTLLSTLDDNLAASDLFGHLSGSYTDARQSRPGHFVSANKGTLFLDEIGKATPAIQGKLLHAVENREIWPVGADRAVRLDVRIVAATNIPLESLVERGVFLDDLAARLTSFRVRLPALRERREDIPDLVRQFVQLRATSCGHPGRVPRVSAELMKALTRAEWPYNLRQLDAAVQRLLIEGGGEEELGVAHGSDVLDECGISSPGVAHAVTPAIVRARMAELGSATATARSLGISRWTVYRYLERAADQPVAGD
jgi:DNA-binding NtrC family response regulator